VKRLLACIAYLINAYREARAASETRRQLHGLSDRMLRDVGLRRDQIGHRDGNRFP